MRVRTRPADWWRRKSKLVREAEEPGGEHLNEETLGVRDSGRQGVGDSKVTEREDLDERGGTHSAGHLGGDDHGEAAVGDASDEPERERNSRVEGGASDT